MNDTDTTIRAIDDRLAELDSVDLEAERAVVAAEMNAGRRVAPERVAAIVAADVARSERMPEAASTRTWRVAFAELLGRAGIVDAVPGTLANNPADGSVFIVSAAAGRVRIGSIDAAAITLAEREELLRVRAALLARERDSGRGGRDRDQVVTAVVENAVLTSRGWELPTQAAAAEALDLADARRIRQVQGPRGWAGIQADARARLAERQPD